MASDLSEMSEWDGTQAPPTHSLTALPWVPQKTRAYVEAQLCQTGNCRHCGRVLISAVPVNFLGKHGELLTCGRCFYAV